MYSGSAHLVARVVQVAGTSLISVEMLVGSKDMADKHSSLVSFSPRISRNSRNFSTGDSASTTVVSQSHCITPPFRCSHTGAGNCHPSSSGDAGIDDDSFILIAPRGHVFQTVSVNGDLR